jgi:nitrogen regulatory protein P-II 1
MKKLEIIVRPNKLEVLKEVLNSADVGGMTVFSAMGCGKQKGNVSEFKNLKINLNLIPKVMVYAVVSDDAVDSILMEIHEKLATGQVGDGKVFVSNVEEAFRIRTAEKGTRAL